MAYTIYNGSKVYYNHYGSGKPVVLLHGFLESSDIWSHLERFDESKFQVIEVDLPGHGRTAEIDDHSMESMACVVVQIVRALTDQPIKLIGHSMGGYVSLAIADLHPEMIAGLCLFHSTAYGDSDQKRADRSRVMNVVEHDPMIFLSQAIPGLFMPENVAAHQTVIDDMIAEASKMKSSAIKKTIIGLRDRPDRTHVLEQARFPVLLIAGKQDPVVPVADLRLQTQMSSMVELHEIENCGHMGFLEARSRCSSILIDFCSKN